MSTSPRRLVSAEREEDPAEASLRPQLLGEFIGQEQVRSNLRVFIEAAKSRGQELGRGTRSGLCQSDGQTA